MATPLSETELELMAQEIETAGGLIPTQATENDLKYLYNIWVLNPQKWKLEQESGGVQIDLAKGKWQPINSWKHK